MPAAQYNRYHNCMTSDVSLSISPISKMIQLIVNGQTQRVPLPQEAGMASESDHKVLNITQLLEHMGLQGKRIAVERNGEIVPRSKFDQPMLADGDRLEIVVAVGGG
jgi:sulfur carrier protein